MTQAVLQFSESFLCPGSALAGKCRIPVRLRPAALNEGSDRRGDISCPDGKTKQNDIAPMAHELFGIGKKSAYNIMVSGYSKKDREHVAKIFEAIWPPFADFILKIFDKKEQQLKQ